jgi:PAS domain S-box-containing protein
MEQETECASSTAAPFEFSTPGDVEDRGLTESNIQFLEERAAAGLWTIDLATMKMSWSRGVFTLLGLDPGAVQPSYAHFNALTHPDDRSLHREINDLLRDGLPFEIIFRIIRPDHRLRWLRVCGETLVHGTGQAARGIGVVQDVTSQRETMQSLKRSGERYQSLISASNALVWTMLPDGQITDIYLPNGEHWSAERYLGLRWEELLHPEDLPGVQASWARAVERHEAFESEYRVCHPDGNYRPRRSRVVPTKNSNGAPDEWVGVSFDVDEDGRWPEAKDDSALTGHQVRGARGILGWSVRILANKSGVSPAVLRRIEATDGTLHADSTTRAVRDALVRGGIEFLYPSSGKPAVRPK